MSERYLKWFPIEGIPFPLDLDKYQKDEDGLTIDLNSEDHPDRVLRVYFAEYEAFRETGEEFKTKFWHETDIEEDYPLFIIEHSQWIEQFHQDSENNFRDLPLMHYAIWTTENWLDILASTKPKVHRLDIGNS